MGCTPKRPPPTYGEAGLRTLPQRGAHSNTAFLISPRTFTRFHWSDAKRWKRFVRLCSFFLPLTAVTALTIFRRHTGAGEDYQGGQLRVDSVSSVTEMAPCVFLRVRWCATDESLRKRAARRVGETPPCGICAPFV